MTAAPEDVIDDADLDRIVHTTYLLGGVEFVLLLERLSSEEILRRIERMESEERPR